MFQTAESAARRRARVLTEAIPASDLKIQVARRISFRDPPTAARWRATHGGDILSAAAAGRGIVLFPARRPDGSTLACIREQSFRHEAAA